MSDCMDSFQIHSSFSELIDCYDGFILDQFGVMHNGQHALDGASECVERLAKMGKKLIILSNSSSLSSATLANLPKLGFDPTNFIGAVTSGEEASHYISKYYSGKKALMITWSSTSSKTTSSSPTVYLEMCGDNIMLTDNVNEADFILLHGAECVRGPNGHETSLGSYHQTGEMSTVIEPILQQCISRDIPMVCCNPDNVMVKPDGEKAYMPGMYRKNMLTWTKRTNNKQTDNPKQQKLSFHCFIYEYSPSSPQARLQSNTSPWEARLQFLESHMYNTLRHV